MLHQTASQYTKWLQRAWVAGERCQGGLAGSGFGLASAPTSAPTSAPGAADSWSKANAVCSHHRCVIVAASRRWPLKHRASPPHPVCCKSRRGCQLVVPSKRKDDGEATWLAQPHPVQWPRRGVQGRLCRPVWSAGAPADHPIHCAISFLVCLHVPGARCAPLGRGMTSKTGPRLL